MDFTKNKKRAQRRKRNVIAKEVKLNKQYRPRVIETKGRNDRKISIKDAYKHLDEDKGD